MTPTLPVRRRLLGGACASLALTVLSSPAALAQQPVAGRNYNTLNPDLPVEVPGKIEVLEFFWYGCPHCYNLLPFVERWEKTLAPDVHYVRMPAIFNERWARDAAIFYTFEALGLRERLHRPFFDAVHKDRLRSDNADALREWLGKQNVDVDKFETTFKSFGVQSKVRRAAQLTGAYRIDGTPSLAVHGRYTISAGQVTSQENMISTADFLVAEVRKQLARAGK